MKFKKSEFVIDADDPFKGDKLERKKSAVILTELLKSIDEPFVLSINSPWGTGKTTFIKMWASHLKQAGFPFIYFNAWENDFTDPMIAFIGEMQTEIVRDLIKNLPTAKKYFEKAKAIGENVAKRALPVAIKIATAGILDLNEFTEQAIAEFSEEVAKKKIATYETDKKMMLEFKTNLEAFVKELSSQNGLPLVFFIDELDRCRPSYSIELLERIKHFFSVRGVVFVLVIDRSELASSIASHYGIINTEEYLRRFVDLEFALPNPSKKEFASYLFETLGFASFFEKRQNEKVELLQTFVKLTNLFGISLRAQEHIFLSFAILIRTTSETEGLFPILALFLIFFKMVNRDLYNQFINQNIDYKAVLTFILQYSEGKKFLDDEYGIRLEAELVCAYAEYQEIDQIINEYGEILQNNQKLSSAEKQRIRFLKNLLDNGQIRRSNNLVMRIAQRIALSENFTQTTRTET